MVYAFGVDLPVIELNIIVTVLFAIGIGFMIWQIIKMNSHISVLENTTLEIRKYEEEEMRQVDRFEVDIKNLESDEAELFLAKTLPSLTKIQNFVAAELMKGKQTDKIIVALSQKGIQKDLAMRVVNGMVYYMNFYHKLPQGSHAEHEKTVQGLKVTPPSGVKMPEPQ